MCILYSVLGWPLKIDISILFVVGTLPFFVNVKKKITAKFEIYCSILRRVPGYLKLSSFVVFYEKI